MPSTTKRTGEPTNPPLGRAERRLLEGMHRRYHHRHFVEPDPLQFLFRYADLRDREVAAVVASALAVTTVLRGFRPEDPLRYDFSITRPGIRRS